MNSIPEGNNIRAEVQRDGKILLSDLPSSNRIIRVKEVSEGAMKRAFDALDDDSVELTITNSELLPTRVRANVYDLAKGLGISKGRILWAKFCSIFRENWSAQALIATKINELKAAAAHKRAGEVAITQQNIERINGYITQALSIDDLYERNQNVNDTIELLRTLPPEQAGKILGDRFSKLKLLDTTLDFWVKDFCNRLYSGSPRDKQYLLEFLKAMQKNTWSSGQAALERIRRYKELSEESRAEKILEYLSEMGSGMKHQSVYRYVGSSFQTKPQMEEIMKELVKDLVSGYLTPDQRASVLPKLDVTKQGFIEEYLGDAYRNAPQG